MRSEHIAEVKYLLYQWGATEIKESRAGSGNIRVSYRWRGKNQFHMCPATPSDHRSTKNTLAELKRILGDPIKPEPKEKRTLEQLTESIKLPASEVLLSPLQQKSAEGIAYLAMYDRDGVNKLEIQIPEYVYKSIGEPPRLVVSRQDLDMWKLAPSNVDGVRVIKKKSGFVSIRTSDPSVTKDLSSWGSTLGHCFVEENAIFASVDLNNLRSVIKKTMKRKLERVEVPDQAPIPHVVVAATDTWQVKNPNTVVPMREEIKDALETIRRAEAAMPMKLARLKDGTLKFIFDEGN